MINPENAALLLMDFQAEIIEMTAGGGSRAAVEKAKVALAAARTRGMPVIFVRVAYRLGHVDASARNKRVAMLRDQGRLVEGTAGASIVPELAPRESEPVVVKRRVSALAHTDLQPLLSALQIDTLVLCGLSTSGVVLSTLRQAADADYRIVVLRDACADGDAEVHRVLTEKIFPAQATVMSVDEFTAGGKGAI
jgi:nicotinamidase-related amidase